ncbi:hypothetical protein V6Z11_D03G096300 [Gossypium hirsutum]
MSIKNTDLNECNAVQSQSNVDKRLTKIFCGICIKEILKGNRPGTLFTKDGWLKIMTNFEKETSKAYSQRQLKNRQLKNRTVDASNDWWESRLKMFMVVIATGDKAWSPSSGTFCNEFFEDVNNDIPEENEEENARNDVHIFNDKSLKQIGRVLRLSSQIEKLCNAVDNMSQDTCSLTPVMNPYGIPQVVKLLDNMSEEVLESSPLYFFSLKLLLNKDKRIIFLSINPKIRALWLKTKMEES